MSDAVTPLAGAAIAPRAGFAAADRGPVGQITLRGDLSDPRLAAVVTDAVGVEVPAARRCNLGEDGRGAVWMGPDELLLLMAHAAAAATAARIGEALEGSHYMVLDVSDARIVLTLTGPDVADTVAKGAPVDLGDGVFPVGTARRTHLGGIAVAIWRTGPESWEIVCLRSYARHLLRWLETAGAEGAEVGWY